MSWPYDNSANRYVKTFMKEFLDLSGEMRVRKGDIRIYDGSINIQGQSLQVADNKFVIDDLSINSNIYATKLGIGSNIEVSGNILSEGVVGIGATDANIALNINKDATTAHLQIKPITDGNTAIMIMEGRKNPVGTTTRRDGVTQIQFKNMGGLLGSIDAYKMAQYSNRGGMIFNTYDSDANNVANATLILDSSHNVGIGTTTWNDAHKLHVQGTLNVSNGIVGTLQTASQPNITSLGTLTSLTTSGATNLNSTSINGTGVLTLNNTTGTSNEGGELILKDGTNASPQKQWFIDNYYNSSSALLRIRHNNWANPMVFDEKNKRIGINKSNPSQMLDISGNVLIDNGVTGEGNQGGKLIFSDAYGAAGPNKIQLQSSGYGFGVNGNIFKHLSGSTTHRWYYNASTDGNGTPASNGTTAMTLYESTLGINLNSPNTSYKLDVNGTSQFRDNVDVNGITFHNDGYSASNPIYYHSLSTGSLPTGWDYTGTPSYSTTTGVTINNNQTLTSPTFDLSNCLYYTDGANNNKHTSTRILVKTMIRIDDMNNNEEVITIQLLDSTNNAVIDTIWRSDDSQAAAGNIFEPVVCDITPYIKSGRSTFTIQFNATPTGGLDYYSIKQFTICKDDSSPWYKNSVYKQQVLGGLSIGTGDYIGCDLSRQELLVQGNVGIGMTNPDYKLDVKGADAAQDLVLLNVANYANGNNTAASIRFTANNSGTTSLNDNARITCKRYASQNYGLVFSTLGEESMYIRNKNASGATGIRVGIGSAVVADPSATLEVDGNLNIGHKYSDTSAKTHSATTNYIGDFLFQNPNTTTATLRAEIQTKMAIGANGTNVLTIDGANERIGIMNNAPATELDVDGNLTLRNPTGGEVKMDFIRQGNTKTDWQLHSNSGLFSFKANTVGGGTILQLGNKHDDTKTGALAVGGAIHTTGPTLQVIGDASINSHLTVGGDLKVNGNINFDGDVIQTNTLIKFTESIDVSNSGTQPALRVNQIGANDDYAVAEFLHNDAIAMSIRGDSGYGGDVSMNHRLSVAGDASFGNIYVAGNLIAPNLALDSLSIDTITMTPSNANDFSIAIGKDAGLTNQSPNSIAIGSYAGKQYQANESIAIGLNAGTYDQSSNSIAIGSKAAQNQQGARSVAIGDEAGRNNQLASSIAIGDAAGQTSQQTKSIAIGYNAGNTDQSANSIAIGSEAGWKNQSENSVAIGYIAGTSNQSENSVAIGNQAGWINQNKKSVAIGILAGKQYQGSSAIAMGNMAGSDTQGNNSIGIGGLAGQSKQNTFAIAIGGQAGRTNQGTKTIALGYLAGNSYQNQYSIAIGNDAGRSNQNQYSIAIGRQAADASQNEYSVAIGYQTAYRNQSHKSIAIGYQAGYENQTINSLAIGLRAGHINQGRQDGTGFGPGSALAIGYEAGNDNQGFRSIAMGLEAGKQNQRHTSIAIGYQAGMTSQSYDSLAIGLRAGYRDQSDNCIAVGFDAGYTNQGTYSVAMGFRAGYIDQHANTIILNAQGSPLNSTSTNSVYIKPVRQSDKPALSNVTVNNTQNSAHHLNYDIGSGEVSYSRDIDISLGAINLWDSSLNIWGSDGGPAPNNSNTNTAPIYFKARNPTQQWTMASIAGYYAANNGTSNNFPGGLAFNTKRAGAYNTALTTAMVIDASGQVGIGNTTPDSQLTIGSSGTSSNQYIKIATASGNISGIKYKGANANEWYTQHHDGNDNVNRFAIGMDSNEYMSIISGGKVGIGSTNPSQMLDISGNVRIDNGQSSSDTQGGKLIFDNAYNIAGPNKILLHSSGYGFGVDTHAVKYNSNVRHVFYVKSSSTTDGDLALEIHNSKDVSMNGGASISGGAYITGDIGNANTTKTPPGVYLGTLNNTYAMMQMVSSDVNGGWIDWTDTNSNSDSDFEGRIRYSTADITGNHKAGFNFYTDETHRMVIDTSGNVGIGMTNPAYKLDIKDASGGQDLVLLNVANYSGSNDTAASIGFTAVSAGSSSTNNAKITCKRYKTQNYGLVFSTRGDESMHIRNTNTTGIRVGIGSTVVADPSATLEVDGNLNIGHKYSDNSTKTHSATTNYIGDFLFQNPDTTTGVLRSEIQNKMALGAKGTNVLTIDGANQRVGIGVTEPVDKLSIDGNIYLNGDGNNTLRKLIFSKVHNGSGDKGSIEYQDISMGFYSDQYFKFYESDNNTEVFAIDGNSGDVNIPTGKLAIGKSTTPSQVLDVVGNITATGTITSSSDVNLKTNVKPLENALEKISKLQGVSYNRNDLEDKEASHIGVIAQEIEKEYPEVVSESETGKRVAYGNMIAPLIEAIKELNIKINELGNENAELKERINVLEQK